MHRIDFHALPLIEPVFLQTVFFSGICPPTSVGDHWHVTLYEIRPNERGELERIAVMRAAATPANYLRSVFTALEPLHRIVLPLTH